jgi:hypothetical protein
VGNSRPHHKHCTKHLNGMPWLSNKV